ncbi:unnamed protein product [Oikopleura dioica]|uniref:Ribosome-recycling factor, mitochondrial n=1 Tax=Oikopleura dioica TaxID=34765 RepID=E4Z124_OIKDI|nr:unnamed protein product [Oikopleura dioica]
MLRCSEKTIRRALTLSRARLALPDHLKLENIDIKKNKNQRFLEGPKERGRIAFARESDSARIREAGTVGQLSVLYDGDVFCLEDLATLAASRSIVKASVAGCPELVQPISQACQKANLIATSQNEVITIKIPPTTAASRKKLVKNVDQIEKSFSQKMNKLQTSQYLKAMEAAESSSQYSQDLEEEWAAKSLAAHVILTLEKMMESAEAEISKNAEAKRHELLGTKQVKKKKNR